MELEEKVFLNAHFFKYHLHMELLGWIAMYCSWNFIIFSVKRSSSILLLLNVVISRLEKPGAA